MRSPGGGGYPHPDVPGTHAEVVAVNRLLRERQGQGLDTSVTALSEIVTTTSAVSAGQVGRPQRLPSCANCRRILGPALPTQDVAPAPTGARRAARRTAAPARVHAAQTGYAPEGWLTVDGERYTGEVCEQDLDGAPAELTGYWLGIVHGRRRPVARRRCGTT